MSLGHPVAEQGRCVGTFERTCVGTFEGRCVGTFEKMRIFNLNTNMSTVKEVYFSCWVLVALYYKYPHCTTSTLSAGYL